MGASFPFLGFAAVALVAYYARRSMAWREFVLAAANVCFLATFSLGLASYVPLAGFLIAGYAGVTVVRRYPRVVAPVLVAMLAGFVWLKKYAFVPAAFSLHFVYVTVGMSYILFRVLHLIVDRRSISALSYFNYTCNFLTLVSGPIQLYPGYVKMRLEAAARELSWSAAARSIERVIKGFFKVNVLAALLYNLHTRNLDVLFAAPPLFEACVAAALVLVLYVLFLYCNFSGYIDMVIGLGSLFGFRLPENFDSPFLADNFIDFWSRRWHITLSAWLRMYVYNPLLLGLMRRFPSRRVEGLLTVFAFFVTFFLVGIWHGQTTEFLWFGFFMGLGVSLNKAYQILMTARMGRKNYLRLSGNAVYLAFSRGLTFTYFVSTSILFWSNWPQMAKMRAALSAPGIAIAPLIIFVCATVVLSISQAALNAISARSIEEAFPLWPQCWRAGRAAAHVVIILLVAMLMNQRAPDLVYKAF